MYQNDKKKPTVLKSVHDKELSNLEHKLNEFFGFWMKQVDSEKYF